MKTSIFGSYTEKCTTIDLKNFITISYLNNIYLLVDIIYLFICIFYAFNYISVTTCNHDTFLRVC